MNTCTTTCFAAAALVAASFAFAQPAKDTKPAKPATTTTTPAHTPTQPAGQPQLPKGMTEADMQACIAAGTPGPMHEHLAKGVGTWTGKSTMWMTSESEPTVSDCTSTVTTMMDGKFTKCEMKGDMPGMGAFNGFGIYGFDNVSQKFQATWIDSMGTGMMTGTGDLSSDGKTITWNYTFNCPITRKPTIMREVERVTGPDSMTLEMFGPDPKTGKEYKMMEITLNRTSGAPAVKSGR